MTHLTCSCCPASMSPIPVLRKLGWIRCSYRILAYVSAAALITNTTMGVISRLGLLTGWCRRDLKPESIAHLCHRSLGVSGQSYNPPFRQTQSLGRFRSLQPPAIQMGQSLRSILSSGTLKAALSVIKLTLLLPIVFLDRLEAVVAPALWVRHGQIAVLRSRMALIRFLLKPSIEMLILGITIPAWFA